MIPNIKCSNCNNDIYKSPYTLKHHKVFFCDRSCQSQYQSQYQRNNSKIIIVNCNHCNKQISKNSSQQRNSKTGLFFCDNLCKNKYLAKNKRWQKDNVNSHHKRKDVLYEKVKNTCQKCGYNEDKRMLDIHHYDHNHQNNKCDNLRVLCVWCHIKHHRLKEEYILPVIITFAEMQKEIDIFQVERQRERKEITYHSKICIKCKNEFKTITKKQKYCSHKCAKFGRRKVSRPSIEQLLQEIKETNYCAVGRKYGVSDNAIRKWLSYKYPGGFITNGK